MENIEYNSLFYLRNLAKIDGAKKWKRWDDEAE